MPSPRSCYGANRPPTDRSRRWTWRRRHSLNLQALQILRQPHLEPEDLQVQVRFFEQSLTVLGVLGLDKGFEQVVEISFDPFTQHETVVAGKLTRVVARPENQVVGLGNYDQFRGFFH